MSRVVVLLAQLKLAFPRDPITQDRFDLYVHELASVDPAALEAAVREIIRTRTGGYFPAIAEIINAAAEHALGLPSPDEALAQVEARIRWGRERAGEAPAVHPAVVEALEQVGGFHALRTAEKPSVIRGQFLNLYRDRRAAALRAAALTPTLPALPASPERKELP